MGVPLGGEWSWDGSGVGVLLGRVVMGWGEVGIPLGGVVMGWGGCTLRGRVVMGWKWGGCTLREGGHVMG